MVATARLRPVFRSVAPEPYSTSVSAAAAFLTSSESAGWKPLVRARVAAGVLTVHTETRSSGDRAGASAVMMQRACFRGSPAWLADASTITTMSRGRAGAASRVGLICQAKSRSPPLIW